MSSPQSIASLASAPRMNSGPADAVNPLVINAMTAIIERELHNHPGMDVSAFKHWAENSCRVGAGDTKRALGDLSEQEITLLDHRVEGFAPQFKGALKQAWLDEGGHFSAPAAGSPAQPTSSPALADAAADAAIALSSTAPAPGLKTYDGAPVPNDDKIYYLDNGKFFKDGEQFTLMGIMSRVISESVNHLQSLVAGSLQEMQDSNDESQAAEDWMAQLDSARYDLEGQRNANDTLPGVKDKYIGHLTYIDDHGEDRTTAIARDPIHRLAADFKAKWGYDPLQKFGGGDIARTDADGAFIKDSVEQIAKQAKAYAGSINKNQASISLKIKRYSSELEAGQELLASVQKAIGSLIQDVARNIG